MGQLPRPDGSWGLEKAGRRVAGCSLWWEGLPVLAGHRVGAMGHLQASQAEAAIALLHQACRELQRRGCTLALGPMDGDTWHDYRCATDWAQGPPFWGEPPTDPNWLAWLTGAGFLPWLHYESRLCLDLHQTYQPRHRQTAPPSLRLGSARAVNLEDLLAQIHPLVMASFRRQPLFKPLSAEVFGAHYRPLLTLLDPDLVQLAWQDDRLVGVLLALPDRLAPPAHRRLLIKTLAVWPDRAYAGLGYALLEAAHRAGAAQGYRQAIHGLMHSHNVSLNLSRHYSRPFRQYRLMGKLLV
jgi:GNAT superfamily N-acetyltransferase